MPWLIRVGILLPGSISSIDRYIVILGASDKNRRGLGVYESIADYLSKPPMPKAVALMFEGGKNTCPF